MSEIDNAMLARIKEIVLEEETSFCYRDFLEFKVYGKRYTMCHGTFRNKICKLTKEGIVELEVNSGIAFYTLKGHRFVRNRKMTRVGVSHHGLYDLILDLPLRERAIHDIRLRFKIPDLWYALSRYCHSINYYSKDIALPAWEFNDARITTTVHKTGTVSVIVACSSNPISLDINGILRLSNCLTRVEERIQMYILEICGSARGPCNSLILVPSHMDWTVTMWHYGADAMTEYGGQKFYMSWKIANDILVRVYSKGIGGNMSRIRLERQECPRKSLVEAIQEKLR